jgi:lipid A 3-O-deacylase PagL
MVPGFTRIALASLAVLLLAGPVSAAPELPLRPPTDLTLSTGAANIRGGLSDGLQLDWEFHYPAENLPGVVRRLPGIRLLGDPFPVSGLMATADGALYGYVGLRTERLLGRYLVFSPSLASGIYYRGDGKLLGGALEFRSGIELSYRLPRDARLGVALYHLSNGGLYGSNPGTEALLLTYHARLR